MLFFFFEERCKNTAQYQFKTDSVYALDERKNVRVTQIHRVKMNVEKRSVT
jgi:hypothetical protein